MPDRKTIATIATTTSISPAPVCRRVPSDTSTRRHKPSTRPPRPSPGGPDPPITTTCPGGILRRFHSSRRIPSSRIRSRRRLTWPPSPRRPRRTFVASRTKNHKSTKQCSALTTHPRRIRIPQPSRRPHRRHPPHDPLPYGTVASGADSMPRSTPHSTDPIRTSTSPRKVPTIP